MFNKIKKVICAALIFGATCISASATELSDWAHDDYINANRAKIVPFSVGSQSMGANITREALCELIVNTYEKISGEEIPEYKVKPFTDCENQTVINAYGIGLVGGTGENLFSPENPVTREEMAKMLYNMLVATDLDIKFSTAEDAVLKNYSDAEDVSEWARASFATALNHSLMNGYEGALLPTGNATCEQAIVAANRAYNAFKKTEQESGQMISIMAPAENAALNGGDVNVLWTAVENAESYKVVLRNSDGRIVLITETKEVSAAIAQTNFITDDYHITVCAVMPDEKEVFSLPLTFKYTNPDLQALVLPAASGILTFEGQARTSDAKDYSQESPIVSAIFAEAEKHLGTPYRYGGTTPAGFDCSGFVQYVFKQNGISLKRTSRDQYANCGTSILKEELKPGDLVFFGSGGVVGHVGIYAGNGQMIHSPSTGKSIMYTSIETDYYKSHYIGAKRIIQ